MGNPQIQFYLDFTGGSDGKVSIYNAGDPSSIPGLGRSSGEGNSSPLWCSCLENPMARSMVGYSPCGHKELDTTERLHCVVDRITTPEDIHILIPRTFEYIRLQGKGELRLQMEIRSVLS